MLTFVLAAFMIVLAVAGAELVRSLCLRQLSSTVAVVRVPEAVVAERATAA